MLQKELQPGWNSISKWSMVGAGEFVSVSQLAGPDTKTSPWPQEWLKLQTFFRSPWHVPKPLQGGATQGCCSGRSWASSRLATVSNSRCSQQVLLFNSNSKFLPWFYDKAAVAKPPKAALTLPFNPSPPPSILQNNLAEKESRFYDARAQFSSNCGRWTSQRMTKSLAGVNMLICLKTTSSQTRLFPPTPMQHNLGQTLQGAECLSSLTSRGAEDARYPLERAISFLWIEPRM